MVVCYPNEHTAENILTEKRSTVNEFSLYRIFRLVVKNFFIILLSAIICAVGAFCYCNFFVEERYVASGSIVVTNGGIIGIESDSIAENEKVNNADIAASINLIKTVKDTLSTTDIYKLLSEKLNNKYTASQLKSFASISTRDDYSLFIDIKFEMNNPQEVAKITNMFLDLTPDYINDCIPNTKTKVFQSDGMVAKTYPQTFSTTVFAAFIGALISFAIVYIISLFNTTIESEEEFKNRYNIPVLGDIPDFSAAKSGKYTKSYYKGGSYYGN